MFHTDRSSLRASSARYLPRYIARAVSGALALALLHATVTAQTALPPEVEAALQRVKVPREAVTLLVVDADGKTAPRLSHRANVPVNPASIMKLVTTYAALDVLGPAFTWRTPVYVDGAVRAGTLTGNVYIKGQGDPKLVIERLWLLLRRLQGLGMKTIDGDMVLDHTAFEAVAPDPASFDGEPLRPYNAAPDALLFNFKSVLMTFVPDAASKLARVNFEPPLAGVQMQATVPLSSGACTDYRGGLKADFSDATQVRFNGTYPASCGEKVWGVAYADPASYSTRAVQGMWLEMGGKINGSVRDGKVPAAVSAVAPTFEVSSPPLAEVIRDINKYSNNVMAQQVFLTLSLQATSKAAGNNAAVASAGATAVGTLDGSRELINRWWKERIGKDSAPAIDNGSGLSRDSRISAQALAQLLQYAWRSPLMPELMSSLPVAGVDGTVGRSRARSLGNGAGNAHLKSGSLRDVMGVAGYVHAASGKRYVLVAITNHANANATRPVIDALVDWAWADQ